jgi:methionyl-tRNA formyltransferase
MRTVFFGTPDIALPSLAAVHAAHEVAAVVCQPDKPKGRSGKPVAPPVKARALENGLDVHQPAKLNDGAFEAWLRDMAPDICVVAAYGRMLKQPLLDVPPCGFINLHPSLLPRWRGPSPIRTAILEGDETTGATIMKIVLEMDAGDILIQEETPIGPEENNIELSERLAAMGGKLMARALDLIAAGKAEYTPQDPEKVTFSEMFTKERGRIRWAASAREIHNLVRAAVPWPVAHCRFRDDVCRIHRSAIIDATARAEPGTVTAVEKDRILAAAGEGQVAVLEFQAPGRRALSMRDFLRGCPIAPGERFEDIV